MVIKHIIFIILLVISLFLVYKFFVSYKKFELDRDKLYDFLCEINDQEALKYFGFINFMGVHEKRYVSTKRSREYLALREDLMKKEKIIEFVSSMDLFDKCFIKYWCCSVVLIFIAFGFCL